MARTRQPETLTTALARLLTKTLLPDLRERTKQPAVARALQADYDAARAANKTGASLIDWREQLLDQIAAAWALSCVFVRTLEDRGLLATRRLAGPGAADSLNLFYALAPSLGPREYLLGVFKEVARLPGAGDLLGPKHNAAWRLAPSQEGAQALLGFFTELDDDGALRWQFGGPDTRFLGDLYQDLSEAVRERFALLQTPDFVEAFILDRTLTPAIAHFGLANVRVLDPTCGSGHFLLGALDRLFDQRLAAAPTAERGQLALAALKQVYGVDLNPYAVAIARFRLTLRFLQLAGIGLLRNAPRELDQVAGNLVVADALLTQSSGARDFGELFPAEKEWGGDFSMFALEEPEAAAKLLGMNFHVVVGNPPYITCKDPVLREQYKAKYRACYREFSLAAPFAERFFGLAVDSGFTGQITSNSFMKREFGKKLIEDVLPHLDLTEVIDTSGAYIPGHGTPTVILIGRNRRPVLPNVLAVQSKRGEPSTPEVPAQGKVWQAILAAVKREGYEDEFVSRASVARAALGRHPWSLGGGGASDLKLELDRRSTGTLGEIATEIGFGAVTREDEVFLVGDAPLRRATIPSNARRPLVAGEEIRDWSIHDPTVAAWPYEVDSLQVLVPGDTTQRFLWPWKRQLSERVAYGMSQLARGLKWYEYSMFFVNRFRTPLSITFAFVATHNHFVLDRGGKVFNRTAPVIKLPANATLDDHLALLGLLNSSVACFWLKQVVFDKGGGGEDWERRREHDGSKLEGFPVIEQAASIPYASALDDLARTRQTDDVAACLAVAAANGPAALRQALTERRQRNLDRLFQMVALQEELDWLCYGLYGVVSQPRVLPVEAAKRVRPGQRPFEILLARRDESIRSGEVSDEQQTAWFSRHGWQPITDTADMEDADMRALVEARIAQIEASRDLGLIESPTHKRRWYHPDFAAEEKAGLTTWLLDRLEAWAEQDLQQPFTIREAVHALQHEPAVQAVAEVLTGTANYDLERLLTELALTDAVPALAAQRYTDSGLEKRAVWEQTWDLQRREDAGEVVDIPVPPKYGQPDFRSTTYWQLRGKLDVPKERFVHLPGAQRDDDPSPVLLWAGADHLQRALAFAALYHHRQTVEAWEPDRLLPLLAAIAELVPWLTQWHNQPGRGGQRMGDYFARFVQDEARKLGVSVADLAAWRPEARQRNARKGRKAK